MNCLLNNLQREQNASILDMSLQKILKLPLLLVLLASFTVAGCGYTVDEERQKLQGEWQFAEAEKGKNKIDVSAGQDKLAINQDYSFGYGFENTDHYYTGSWELGRGEEIRFYYHQSAEEKRMDVVNFQIETLTQDSLVLFSQEGRKYVLTKN